MGKARSIIILRQYNAVTNADSRDHCPSAVTCSHGGINGIISLSGSPSTFVFIAGRTVHSADCLSLLSRVKSKAQGDLSFWSSQVCASHKDFWEIRFLSLIFEQLWKNLSTSWFRLVKLFAKKTKNAKQKGCNIIFNNWNTQIQKF